MELESSNVAKKLREYFEYKVEDDTVSEAAMSDAEISSVFTAKELAEMREREELMRGPGFFKNCAIIALTSTAILLTKVTLQLTRWINQLDSSV